ncbi:MAG: hypothetical protein ACPGWR_26205, partial [Ardenticatenaceae bacterium]
KGLPLQKNFAIYSLSRRNRQSIRYRAASQGNRKGLPLQKNFAIYSLSRRNPQSALMGLGWIGRFRLVLDILASYEGSR